MREVFATIWRKSILDNNYKCTRCGALLSTSNGKYPDNTLINDDEYLWVLKTNANSGATATVHCKDCMYKVARIEKINVAEDFRKEFGGDFEDFQNVER